MNVTEITNIAAAAALAKLNEAQPGCRLLAISPNGYNWPKDTPAREAFTHSVITQALARIRELPEKWAESFDRDRDTWRANNVHLSISGACSAQYRRELSAALAEIETAAPPAPPAPPADICPLDPPPGYIAMRGKDVPSPVPAGTWCGRESNGIPVEWQASGYIGLVSVGPGNLKYWYAIPSSEAGVINETMPASIELEHVTSRLAWLTEASEQKDAEIERLNAKLAAAESRLAKLEWRPASVRPTEEDADSEGYIFAACNGHAIRRKWHDLESQVTHWTPFNPPTPPTAEAKMRAEVEAWLDKHPGNTNEWMRQFAFAAWQAARKEQP